MNIAVQIGGITGRTAVTLVPGPEGEISCAVPVRSGWTETDDIGAGAGERSIQKNGGC